MRDEFSQKNIYPTPFCYATRGLVHSGCLVGVETAVGRFPCTKDLGNCRKRNSIFVFGMPDMQKKKVHGCMMNIIISVCQFFTEFR